MARSNSGRFAEHSLGTQLGADRAPFAGDAVDTGLGRPGGDLDHTHTCSRASGLELLLLARLESERLGQHQPSPFARPYGAGLKAQHFQRLPKADLGNLGDVERAAERARDVIEAVQLALTRAMPLLGVVEIPADEARVEMLHDVAEPALGEQQHLVGNLLAGQLLSDPSHNGTAEDGEAVHHRLERDALFRVPL